MTLSRALSLSLAVGTATLSGCAGSSVPNASTSLASTGVSEAQAQTYGAGALIQAQTAPIAVFKTNPPADGRGQISGKAPFVVTFNLCQSTDPDAGDALNYKFTFGDGDTASRQCRADHTYEKQGTFEATVCVADKRVVDRSELCQSYVVHVNGESKSPEAAVIHTDNVTLCDKGWPNAQNGGICGIPSDPSTSYLFDFDSLQKVPVADPSADLAKGHSDCCSWNLKNGALQVDTNVPKSQVATVTCGASDGRIYGPGAVSFSQPSSSVICLRTAQGRYVKYTGRTSCCGDITIDYVAY